MLTINKFYQFTTNAPSVLTQRFTKVKLIDISNFTSALKRFPDIGNMFTAVLPTIIANNPTANISNRPSDYIYYIFSKEDNSEFIMCDLWISNDIEVVESLKINITIDDGNLSDVAEIRNFLSKVLQKQNITINY